MARRSRKGGWSFRGPRDRRPALEVLLWRWLVWRIPFGKVWLFVRACLTYPMAAFAVVLWVTFWFRTGSGIVALVLTPVFMAAGAGAWFWFRFRKTGLTVAQCVAQLRREWTVRQQWDRACEAAGWKVSPKLSRKPWRPGIRSEDDTVVARFSASSYGLAHDPIEKGMKPLAEVIAGGCRSARWSALGHSGMVEIRFAWGDRLSKVIRPNDIPKATPGSAPFGLTEGGLPVADQLVNERGEWVFTPKMLVGVSGSGKSSALWSALLGMIAARVPVYLHVADPKGGMELVAFEDALNDGLGTPLFKVVEYADNEKDITAMVERMAGKMHQRARANKARRVRAHVPTTADSAHLLVIDELLELTTLMKAGKEGALGQIQRLGRACGFSVIAATQLSRAQDLNPQIRDLFVQRLVFRVPNRETVETALGSGMGWSDRAPAHSIGANEKGVGYAINFESSSGDSTAAVRFRCPFIEEDETRDIAAGMMPTGLDRYAREELDPKAFKHFTYWLYKAEMRLGYVGETNNLKRRWQEHARESWWWDQIVQDADHMVTKTFYGPTPEAAEREAKVAESHAIDTELPLWNTKENEKNPTRVTRESVAA